MQATITPTFHAVDDKGLLPAEIFLSFVDAFRFPLRLKSLSEDGAEARFVIANHENALAVQSRANRVIKVLRMPLEATILVNEIGGLPFESLLIVKMTDR